jgi:hypothetical protein
MTYFFVLSVFVSIAYSLTFIVVFKRPPVFKPLYMLFNAVGLGKAVECIFCMGFWTSLTVSAVNHFIFPYFCFSPSTMFINFEEVPWYNFYVFGGILVDAFCGSSLVYLLNSVQEALESHNSI